MNDKSKYVEEINKPASRLQLEVIEIDGKHEVFYHLYGEESSHTLTATKTFEGFTLINEELIQIMMIGGDLDDKTIRRYLELIKFSD